MSASAALLAFPALRHSDSAHMIAAPPLLPQLAFFCPNCHAKELCLPCALSGVDAQRLALLMIGRRKVRTGRALYRAGDPFRFVYAVRTGTFKSALALSNGSEQICAFHMAGELMGLDGLAQGHHASGATALEDAEVCAIPYAELAALAAGSVALQSMLARLMSQEIVREHALMVLLGSTSAEERVAAFLLHMSRAMEERGWSPIEFHLRMSRAEIGSYLGLKLETVSRTFSMFSHQGLMEVDKRHIRLRDPQALARVCDLRVH